MKKQLDRGNNELEDIKNSYDEVIVNYAQSISNLGKETGRESKGNNGNERKSKVSNKDDKNGDHYSYILRKSTFGNRKDYNDSIHP